MQDRQGVNRVPLFAKRVAPRLLSDLLCSAVDTGNRKGCGVMVASQGKSARNHRLRPAAVGHAIYALPVLHCFVVFIVMR